MQKNKIKYNIYSIKILKKIKILSEKLIERQYNEYKDLSSIYHSFIIELKGINHLDPYIYYIYEFPGEPLAYLIKINNTLSLDSEKFYSPSVITELDYLYKKNYRKRFMTTKFNYKF